MGLAFSCRHSKASLRVSGLNLEDLIVKEGAWENASVDRPESHHNVRVQVDGILLAKFCIFSIIYRVLGPDTGRENRLPPEISVKLLQRCFIIRFFLFYQAHNCLVQCKTLRCSTRRTEDLDLVAIQNANQTIFITFLGRTYIVHEEFQRGDVSYTERLIIKGCLDTQLIESEGCLNKRCLLESSLHQRPTNRGPNTKVLQFNKPTHPPCALHCNFLKANAKVLFPIGIFLCQCPEFGYSK